MFTGFGPRLSTNDLFRRDVKNKVIARPKSGVASGADHS